MLLITIESLHAHTHTLMHNHTCIQWTVLWEAELQNYSS